MPKREPIKSEVIEEVESVENTEPVKEIVEEPEIDNTEESTEESVEEIEDNTEKVTEVLVPFTSVREIKQLANNHNLTILESILAYKTLKLKNTKYVDINDVMNDVKLLRYQDLSTTEALEYIMMAY